MRGLSKFVLILPICTAAAWYWAGRAAGPQIQIRQPEKFIGQTTSLDLVVQAPGGRFTRVDATIEQAGKSLPVFSLDAPAPSAASQNTADRLFVMRPIGKQAVPDLAQGPARIVVRATRPVLYGLRQVTSEARLDVEVRLEPPRVAVLSTFHFVNQGGSEFVVYRASPADVQSGVRVGDESYPGFPASAVGITGDDTLRVAFFALLYDQDVNAPFQVFARDGAGNEAVASLDHRVFPKTFRQSRIPIDDSFLQRVVPAIAASTPDMQISPAPADLLQSFLQINGELRQRNNQTIAELAAKTAPEMLWRGPFKALGNASVEARFADSRTYLYEGKEVDQQVHLGFDLAVTVHVPVLAAHDGRVIYAGPLGIYGNCVVLDHGLGVQSLYGHFSSLDVQVGDTVTLGQTLGRSGMTGLAAGDHLHFTMLLNGHPVNSVEWWDQKWMEDRVLRKIRDAGGRV